MLATGIQVGFRDGLNEGLGVGVNVVGVTVSLGLRRRQLLGLGEGMSDGYKDIVGKFVGIGIGTVEGNRLGDGLVIDDGLANGI